MSDVTGSGGTPVRPGVANAAAPTYVENRLVRQSFDLSGNQRVLSTVYPAPAATGIGKTKIRTITNLVAVELKVVGASACGTVSIAENAANPVADYYIMKPTSADDRELLHAGQPYTFPAPAGTQWQTGQTVGWMITVSTTADFCQDESA